MSYKLAREERETVIRGNAASHSWEVVTADPRIIRKLTRQGFKPDDHPNPWSYVSFTLPFNRIGIRRADRRTLSEGQQQNIYKANSARKTIQPLLSERAIS